MNKYITFFLFICSFNVTAVEIVNFDFSKDFYQQLNIGSDFYYDEFFGELKHEECTFKNLTIDDLREYVSQEITVKLKSYTDEPMPFTTDKFLSFYNLHKSQLDQMGVISCADLMKKNKQFKDAVSNKVGSSILKLSVSFFNHTGNLYEVKVVQQFPNSSSQMIKLAINRYIDKWQPLNIETLRNSKPYLNVDRFKNGAKFKLKGGVECTFEVYRNNTAQTTCQQTQDFVYIALKEYPEIVATFEPYIGVIYQKYIALKEKEKGGNETFVY